MAAWPASLPQSQLLGSAEQLGSGALRTGMDAGPPKVRKRFTATIRTFEIPLVLTGAQRATLKTFFETTVNHGADAFDWEGLDDTVESFRFVEPPSFVLQQGHSDPDQRVYQTSLKLEVLP